MSLSLYGIIGAVLLTLLAGTGAYGYEKGSKSAATACKASEAITLQASLNKWQETRQAQDLRDSAAHAADAERQKAATDALTAIQTKWENMRVAVVKMPPAAKCELSPTWVQFYNGTNP